MLQEPADTTEIESESQVPVTLNDPFSTDVAINCEWLHEGLTHSPYMNLEQDCGIGAHAGPLSHAMSTKVRFQIYLIWANVKQEFVVLKHAGQDSKNAREP